MPTRRARLRRRIYRSLPDWLTENDFEFLVSALCLFSGLPLLLDRVHPPSINDLLPRPIAYSWGVVLTLAGAVVLFSILMSRKKTYPDRVFWLRLKAWGLSGVAYACYLYSVCLVAALTDSWVASCLILAIGLICHLREVSIHMNIESFKKDIGLSERH